MDLVRKAAGMDRMGPMGRAEDQGRWRQANTGGGRWQAWTGRQKVWQEAECVAAGRMVAGVAGGPVEMKIQFYILELKMPNAPVE